MTMGLLLSGCSLYFGDDTTPAPPEDPPEPLPPGPWPSPPTPPGPTTPPTPMPPPSSCGDTEVHLIGVYETRGDHSAGNHPVGAGSVRIDRPGHHVVIVSAYEPTAWTVTAGEGATIDAIFAIGYHAQTISGPPGAVVADTSHEEGGAFACGYSWPYNGEGCDTNRLVAWARAQAGELTSFHGCYRATSWTIGATGATSDCATDQGYEVNGFAATCDGGGGGGWQAHAFTTAQPYTGACTGARFVRFSDEYGLWVGAALCGSADRYKLFLSTDPESGFLEIADFGGHGQDHCELVNPAFRIPNDDDVTSGGCATCATGPVDDIDGVEIYARSSFGDPFERTTARFWADLTTPWYACGVAIAAE